VVVTLNTLLAGASLGSSQQPITNSLNHAVQAIVVKHNLLPVNLLVNRVTDCMTDKFRPNDIQIGFRERAPLAFLGVIKDEVAFVNRIGNGCLLSVQVSSVSPE